MNENEENEELNYRITMENMLELLETFEDH